ncbi:hypothetical protein EDB85DRAFT_1101445 [Lactarius pseudohatsudake]|nr:hypothetical protein EDB85DRAFT_1101445 [Lactarius pseudohatsudake]
MGMLFENTSDDDFMPPSGLGKGKGRAVVVDGIVELSESVAAAAGSRMRRKSWRKELADEAEVGENNDSDDESEDDDGPRAHAVSAPVFTNARRKKRTPASSSSGVLPGGLTFCHHCRSTTRRPKMRCTLIKASTEKRCRNLFCDRCIEKRYPQLTFDRAVEDFECPACCNYCNCSLCSRKRGEAYIPERNGGWRSWIARQGGSHRAAPTPAKRSKSNNLGTTLAATKTTKKPAIMTTTTTTTDAEVFDGRELERDGSVHGIWRAPRQCVLARQQSGHRARLPTHGLPYHCYYHPQCAREFYLQPDTRTHAGTAAIAETPACVYWETAQDVGAARVPSGSRPRPAGAAEGKDEREGEGKDGGPGTPG